MCVCVCVCVFIPSFTEKACRPRKTDSKSRIYFSQLNIILFTVFKDFHDHAPHFASDLLLGDSSRYCVIAQLCTVVGWFVKKSRVESPTHVSSFSFKPKRTVSYPCSYPSRL